MADASPTGAVRRTSPAAAGALVAVGLLPPTARFVFRGSREAADACARAFACELPHETCRAAEESGRAALWLGPDEWLLLAPEDGTAAIGARIETALASIPHALVDVSHRQVGFAVAGAAAAAVLNAGCPLDLDLPAFPTGMCTRTVLAKCDIVLWRRAPELFRLEVNRSFADYVAGYLRVAERGIG